MAAPLPKPFDGAISRYFQNDAPDWVRRAVEGDEDILDPAYPYRAALKRKAYEREMAPLQIEMMKAQRWIQDGGARLAVVFEGRDAAGKGGTIRAVTLNTNPRVTRIVALAKPTDKERGQWYFQRYAGHLPSAGEAVLFDRSWYNRAGVEPVMGFCTPAQHQDFLRQAPDFERMIVDGGVTLIKLWLTVGRAEQMRRFLAREADPLKHWKLSPIDIASLGKWDDFAAAKDQMFAATHSPHAPWTVIRSDDKKRARLAAMRIILGALPYADKDAEAIGEPDPQIVGAPEKFD